MKYKMSVLLPFIFCTACSSQYEKLQPIESQIAINKSVVTEYLGSFGTADAERVSAKLLTADHKLLRSEFANLEYNAAGDPGLTEGSVPVHLAITDRTNTITALVAEEDRVAVRMRVEGTHAGKLYGVPASNKPFWFDEVAIFRLSNGKIMESWHLGNDGRFLVEIGERLPARADGRIIPPPTEIEAYPGDVWVERLSSDGIDSPQEQNKITVAKYNADRFRGGRTTPIPSIYEEYLHSGNQVTDDLIENIEKETGMSVPGGFAQAWSGRSDLLIDFIAEDNMLVMWFQLNALNAGPLYSIPPTGKQIRSWEVLVAEFDGETWKSAWWFGDDLGLYLKLGTEEAVSFFFEDLQIAH